MKPFWITLGMRIEADNVDDARSVAYELLEYGSENNDADLYDVIVSVDEE